MKPNWLLSLSMTCLALVSPLQTLAASEIRDVATGGAPDIVANSKGDLCLVFEGFEKDVKIPDIFFTQSIDGGTTWSTAKNISHAPGISDNPAIALEKNGAIDVVWSDTTSGATSPDIYFARSSDGGKTWTDPKDISNTPGESIEAVIATAPDDSIHVAWSDSSKGQANKDIYYSCSSDGGKSWSKDPLLPATDISNSNGASSFPTIAVDADGCVHVAWVDNTSGEKRPDIYYARKTKDAWSKPIRIYSSARVSAHPAIACSQHKVYVCWSDNSLAEKAADIWLAVKHDQEPFAKPLNISSTIGVSSEPDIACDALGRLGVVWQDSSQGVEKPDIYARISMDGALTFSTVYDLSNTPGISMYPDATIAGNKLFVVWQELGDGAMRLKLTTKELKKSPAAPAEEIEPPMHGGK